VRDSEEQQRTGRNFGALNERELLLGPSPL